MACSMLPSQAAMAASTRCSPETSGWRKCLRADRYGYSRSSNNRRSRMQREISCQTAATFAAVAVLSVLLLATARAADERNEAQIDHGKATYAQKCSHCHGPNLVNSGTVTPDLRGFPDDKPRFVT